MLGAVGGPAFDSFPSHLRPERGLLRLRQALGVFANLRPAVCFAGLEDTSPLRAEVVRRTDDHDRARASRGHLLGEPRSTQGAAGDRVAIDTMRYAEPEIERIAHVAFELARSRRRKVTSVDKANVLDCSRLWREVVNRVGQQYSDVKLNHAYVDSAAMALVARPADFDVVLTENMFGDILSDQAGAVVGSLGMLGSASIGGLGRPLRAGAWLCSGHRRARHRQPSGRDSVGGDVVALLLQARGRSGLCRIGGGCSAGSGIPDQGSGAGGRARSEYVGNGTASCRRGAGACQSFRPESGQLIPAPVIELARWISTKFFRSTGCISHRRE